MTLKETLDFLTGLLTAGTLMRVALLCIIIIVAKVAWNLQQASVDFDIKEFIRDPNSMTMTTERLGHFVALWVTTVAFCFMLTLEDVDKETLFLTYGGMWITSRAMDKFASRKVLPPAEVTVDTTTATVNTNTTTVNEDKGGPRA